MSAFTDLQDRYQQSDFKPGFSAIEKVILYFPKNRSLQEQAATELARQSAALQKAKEALRLVRASDDKHISRGETALHGNARVAVDAALAELERS